MQLGSAALTVFAETFCATCRQSSSLPPSRTKMPADNYPKTGFFPKGYASHHTPANRVVAHSSTSFSTGQKQGL